MGYDYAAFQDYAENHPEDHFGDVTEMMPESRITASEAKRWADAVWGHGAVSLVKRDGAIIHRVGFIDQEGYAVYSGEGKTWDDAVTRSGGDPEEIESIRRNGQG